MFGEKESEKIEGSKEPKEITKTIKDDNDNRKYYKNMDSSKDYKRNMKKKYNNDIVWTRATSRNQSTPNLQAIKILDAHNKEEVYRY